MNNVRYGVADKPPLGKMLIFGIQQAAVCFASITLVPLLCRMNIAACLLTAGLGTLLYMFTTGGFKNKDSVCPPIILGSSFAFIVPLQIALANYGLNSAMFGVLISGLIYCLISLLVSKFGTKWIHSWMPPLITGPIMIAIGMNLAPTAISMASFVDGNYSLPAFVIAMLTLIIIIIASVCTKGFASAIPVLIGIIGGYIITLILGAIFPAFKFISFSEIKEAAWFGLPSLTLPKPNLVVAIMFVVVSFATICEHICDVGVISRITEHDFYTTPGLHKTLLGDGLATTLASFFGSVPNTTYSESAGLLAISKVHSKWVIGTGAIILALLGLSPKFAALVATIPTCIVGSACIALFGIISASGLRTMIESKIDLSNSRNLLIVSVILTTGIGGLALEYTFGNGITFSLAGVALAVIFGILLNKLLPESKDNYEDGNS